MARSSSETPENRRRNAACDVLVDFDGTLAPDDPTLRLFQQHTGGAWREIDAAQAAGSIAPRESMRRKVDALRLSKSAFDAFAGSVALDPHFKSFLDVCSRHDCRVLIVSDGLDRLISLALARAGLSTAYAANHVRYLGRKRWALDPSAATSRCLARLGNCKCACARRDRHVARVVVGDSHSDFCAADHADFVLAKGSLAEHCRQLMLPHTPIDDFRDAASALERWLAGPIAGDALTEPTTATA